MTVTRSSASAAGKFVLQLSIRDMVPGSSRTALRGVSIDVYTSAMRRTESSIHPVRVGLLHRRKVLRFAAALPWAVLGAGCGQKGPLYHPPPEPDEEDEDEQTSAAPAAPISRSA